MQRPETKEPAPPSAPGLDEVKIGLARMLKGGVIMDVTTVEQAKIAEEAGAVAVMALERVPADIRKEGGVARMAALEVVERIQQAVTIPVMAKARIGHFVEARILEQVGVDFIDESEVLTPADPENHFVCGATCLDEALRRIGEGAAMLRTKGEAGTGDVVEAVRHLRLIRRQIRELSVAPHEELMHRAKELRAPFHLVEHVARHGSLPVPNFAAGGVATPADAALVMALGAEAVFVGSGIFKSDEPARTAAAIVKATAQWQDAAVLAEASRGVGGAMRGLSAAALPEAQRLAGRGW
jgi:pyridoxal 5'-phosphate synthase pdxS subunit